MVHTAATPSAATAHSRHLPPHSLTCAVLKRFSSIKCNPGMESVIRMCLDAMAVHYLKQQAGQSQVEVLQGTQGPVLSAPLQQDQPIAQEAFAQDLPQDVPVKLASPSQKPPHQHLQSANLQHSLCTPCQPSEQSLDTVAKRGKPASQGLALESAEHHVTGLQMSEVHSELTESAPASNPHHQSAQAEACNASHAPCMTHDDLIQLQSHADDFASKDRREWLINLRFLRHSMQQAKWPGDIWSESALLNMVGRIASNNFGIYSTRQRQKSQMQPSDSISCQGACAPPALLPQAGSCQMHCTVPHKPAQQGSEELSNAAQTQAMPHVTHVVQTASALDTRTTAELQHLSEKPGVSLSAMPWPLLANPKSPSAAIAEPVQAAEGAPTGCDSSVNRPQQHLQQDHSGLLAEEKGSNMADQPCGKGTKHQQLQGKTAGRPAREDVVGREIYITASFFNHSCEPNCVKNRLFGLQSGVASVTALRDIKASHSCMQKFGQLDPKVYESIRQ